MRKRKREKERESERKRERARRVRGGGGWGSSPDNVHRSNPALLGSVHMETRQRFNGCARGRPVCVSRGLRLVFAMVHFVRSVVLLVVGCAFIGSDDE